MNATVEKEIRPIEETSMDVTLEEMLLAREERVIRQQHILQYDTSPLVCFTLNIPGPRKTSRKYEEMYETGIEWIKSTFDKNGISYVFRTDIRRKTGYEYYVSVKEEIRHVKEFMCRLEDGSQLGRVFDIDVLKSDGTKISRDEIAHNPRKCMLCEKQAQICSRSRAHKVSELVEYINHINF